MALLFILLVIAGGMGLSVEAGLLGPLASQVGDLWATMSIFGIGAVLTFFLMLFFSPRSSPSFFSLPSWRVRWRKAWRSTITGYSAAHGAKSIRGAPWR